MRPEHDGCRMYRARPRCRQVADRWDTVKIVLCLLVVFTGVIPVIPAAIAIIVQSF